MDRDPEASRCRFSRSARRWTLQADCIATAPITLPRGVTLDGNGKTITLAGNAEQFESAAIHVREASVHDLAIDGQNLAPHCPSYFAALVVTGPGKVGNVAVANLRFGDRCVSAIGIEMSVFDGEAATLECVTASGIDGAGVLLTGDGQVTIAGASVHDATTGIQVMNAIEASVNGVANDRVAAGIVVTGHARARIRDDDAPDALGSLSAMDNALATLGNLTLAGFEAVSSAAIEAPSLAPIPPMPRQSGRF